MCILLLLFILLTINVNECLSNVRAIEPEDVFPVQFSRDGKKFIYGGVTQGAATPAIWSVFNINRNGTDGEGCVIPSPNENEHHVKFDENYLCFYSILGIETSRFKWAIEWPGQNHIVFVGKTSQANLYNFLYTEKYTTALFAEMQSGTSSSTYQHAENFKGIFTSLLQDFLAHPANQFKAFERVQNSHVSIEEIVGIGGCCLVKREINHYFNRGANVLETKSRHAHFFDWTGIFDYNQLASILRDKLDGIFDRDKLDIKVRESDHPYPVVYNNKYGIRWKHLFENKREFPSFPKSDFKLKDFEQFYPIFEQKMNYLRTKFLSLKDKKTLYVLANIYTDLDNEALSNVRDALLGCREGDSRFALLVITDSTHVQSFENVFVRKAMNIRQEWNGSNSIQWEFILNQFSFVRSIWD